MSDTDALDDEEILDWLKALSQAALEMERRAAALAQEMDRLSRQSAELAEEIRRAHEALIPILSAPTEPEAAVPSPREDPAPSGEETPPQAEEISPAAETVLAPPAERKEPLQVEVWVDGSCLGNPGPGGWAYLLKDQRGRVKEKSGSWPEPTTNNRMEIQALIEALKALLPAARTTSVKVIADSKYLLGLSSGSYVARKNQELVKELRGLIAQFPRLTFKHALGHSGIPENERVDELARKAALKSKKAMSGSAG